MKIAVIGTGYVGLVAGACFADSGTNVVCVDVDEQKLEKLRRGDVPFFEPRLAELVKRNWPHRLDFSSNLAESIRDREVVFVAVGTPPNEDGSADLSHVLTVAEQVAKAATHDLALVLKSTVPVGTNERVTEVVKRYAKHRISVVSNPEFLKEGDAVSDFFKPDRVVIGTDDDHAFEALARLYAPYNRQRSRIQRMSPKSAEIVKYAANALLAVKISFMNEIAKLCDVAGGDVEQVRVAVGSDERIGMQFLYPGLGFGGSCFPKDLRALVRTGEELGVKLELAAAAVRANEVPVRTLLSHMEADLGGVAGKTIAVWGIAFKPRTDDVREAPSLKLIQELVARGAKIRATDPQALETGGDRLRQLGITDNVQLFQKEYDASEGADALVIATEWNEYRNPDLGRLKELMRGRFIFDGRNALTADAVADAGFVYRGMGRPRRN
ncbi:MAG TPA: UDP-glucose/GDP-mannose dehydrogenase family protein [Polyangiaceae bacterium]|nr:UDP-glucose/GDP-mannose dehydrogenase family protein [Polyangiaceae bacterium]